MNEIPKQFSPEANRETADPYDAVDFFEQHKANRELAAQFSELVGDDSRDFFTENTFGAISDMTTDERLMLLGYAAQAITTRPSDIDTYLEYFPGDTEALDRFVEINKDNIFSHIFINMILSVTLNRVRDKSENYSILALAPDRRELAPDFLLTGHENNEGFSHIEKEFGEASRGYVEAYKEARELEFEGNRPFERRTPFDTPEFEALEESEKSRMLRLCLGAQQLGMVFHEALNSAFTRERVEENNARLRAPLPTLEAEIKKEMESHQRELADGELTVEDITKKAERTVRFAKMLPKARRSHAHSMLFGTEHSNSIYEAPQSRFEREMNATAETRGVVEEYAKHKLTLATVEAFAKREPDPENVSLLVDFWNKNRNPIFGNAIAEALSVQGPEQASQELLELIRTDVRDKNALASILYRLELGKIGMSEEGVRYMGRLYNLGELNNPDFFVNRLTSNGEVGVFDDEEKMVGYFELGDLSDDTEQIDADVLAITYDTLFKDRGEVSKEERARRESFIKEFTEKYFEVYNERFFEKTGTRFNNLTFEEQGWFLSFVSEAGPNLQERVYDFVDQFGEDGIRAFLSMEFDRNMGHHVMEKIAASPKGADILALYNHLVIGTRNAVREFGDDVSPELNKKLDANLMRRAKDILASDISGEETLEALEQVRVENVIFTTAFRTLRTEGVIAEAEDISIMESASFESVSATALSPSDKSRMLEIFDIFWKNEPIKFSSKVRTGLETSFSNPDTSFHVLRHDGVIVGYARVDDNAEAEIPHMYFGSFNVIDKESYAGGKFGSLIYKELIKQAIKKYGRIEADCSPESDIAKFYMRDFVATDFFLAEGERPGMHIVYDPDRYAGTAGASLSREKIIEHAESGSYKSGDIIIREINLDDPAPFPEFEAHRIMTRYFDDTDTGKLYGIFEYDRLPAQQVA